MNRTRLQALGLLAAWCLASAAPARADEITEIARLQKAGLTVEAMAMVDQALATRPKDPQLRFLKGVLLTDAKRNAEAIAVFALLNEDYPELAEPYNNLAVLYAGQGQLDKARVALEGAVRSNPNYATAYENLGDVYARLAVQAYARALALDADNASLAPKIAQLRTLSGSKPAEARPAPP